MAGSLPVSPLAPAAFPKMPAIEGVKLASAAAGIKYKGRTDLMVMLFDRGTTVAGVTTRSLTCSAPVLWCRKVLKGGKARAVVVNSGNANAFTGTLGQVAVEETAKAAAKAYKIKPEEVLLASTGVIGEPLPFEKLTKALPKLADKAKESGWNAAAKAIMTTDTYAKGATRKVMIGKTAVTINGMAKGSGMIAPDMATMLAFVATDAAIPSAVSGGVSASSNALLASSGLPSTTSRN